jgi:LppP/LprE lipoprotein
VGAVLLVAGCGSSKKTKVDVVTVTAPASSPSATTSSPASTTPSTTPAKTSATTTPSATSTATTGGSAATVTTGPASASGSGGGSLAAAEAAVSAKGYTPSVTYSYKPSSTLGVILGMHAPGDERAFFFVNGKFIGTDTSDPSAGLTVTGQSDTSATISYLLFKPGDKLCCPSSHAAVTYALNDGKLEPQGSIPSSSSTASLSRR